MLDIFSFPIFPIIPYLPYFSLLRSTYVLGCGRSSPIWDITEASRKANISDRVESLAHPKIAHRSYQPPREVRISLEKNNIDISFVHKLTRERF